MKLILIAVLLASCCVLRVCASGGVSGEFGVCNSLGISLSIALDQEKKELPSTWEQFELVKAIKQGKLNNQLFSAKAINSFALVPGAPVIQIQSGIPREYSGYRIVFISRKGSITKYAGTGRCALLADPGGENSKQFRVYPVFFPEVLAQVILGQIQGFDPTTQPLAFEDLTAFEREKQQYYDNVRIPNKAPLPFSNSQKEEKILQLPDQPPKDTGRLVKTKAVKQSSQKFGWTAVLVIVLLISTVTLFAIVVSVRSGKLIK